MGYFSFLLERIRSNHALLMVICCSVPLVLLAGFYALGLQNNPLLYWLAVLSCPVSHLLLHWGHEQGKKTGEEKEKKVCH
ncbi:MAG: hypothetical protein QXH27_03940 [Candidatus Micrarchaeia archaeon]